jgi:SAM-dependent methyltransferase
VLHSARFALNKFHSPRKVADTMPQLDRQLSLIRRVHPRVGLAWEHERVLVDEWLRMHSDLAMPLVLDAGCGFQYGLITHYRGRLRTTGVDISFATLQRNRDVDFKSLADAERLPFADGAFDMIFCRDVIEHLQHPDLALRELARVLQPAGLLVLTTVNVENPGIWSIRLVPKWARTLVRSASFGPELGDNAPTYHRANTPSRLRALLTHAGLSVKRELHWPTFLWYFRFSTPALLVFSMMNRFVELCGLSRLFGGLTYGAVKS